MTFKIRVALSFGLFVLLVAALGAGLMVNARREEKAFHSGRNALRSQFMVQEVEYFINKKIKAVEALVLLGEELEKIVIEESDAVLAKKFEVWDKWAKMGEASLDELSEVRGIDAELRVLEAETLKLVDAGNRSGAMKVVGGNYRATAKKARDGLKALTAKKVQAAVESERTMQRVVRQGHMTSVAGILLAVILGIVLAMSLYNSVMLPMKVISMWSEQIAKGHLHVSLTLPGNSEMSRVAENFNGMIQALARQNQDQAQRERARQDEQRERDSREREEQVARAIKKKREEQEKEKEEVSTLEDAVDGFREILDIMGAPPSPREKKR